MLACFGFSKSQKKKPRYPFRNLIVKVDQTVVRESTMERILKKIKSDKYDFEMHGEGIFQVSGALDLKLFLKELEKTDGTARLVCMKSGGCSENLHMKEFEKRQGYKGQGDLKDFIEMQIYYNDLYQKPTDIFMDR